MVVISDMKEVPSSCYDCELNNYHFCDLTGNCIEQNRDDDTKADDCPLKEVPSGKWQRSRKMNRGTVIEHFLKNWEYAEKTAYIRKPFAWAVYQTWKWVDNREKPREVVENAR